MKIAIIGSGISGLVCAHLLRNDYDLSIFEANDYIGGHTHTIDVSRQEGSYAIDTGFIVFNKVTYPNFCKLMDQLGVASQPTRMNFSVRCEKTGLEYGSDSADTLFAQRRNILSPSYWRMVLEIFRLRKHLVEYIASAEPDMPMGEFMSHRNYSQRFIDHFVVPLGASLWSAEPGKILEVPARTFGRFFENHGFLQATNPIQWRVITGGSKQYVEKLVVPFAQNIHLSTPVTRVHRSEDYVELEFADRDKEHFDQVIFATHSDQALKILAAPTDDERTILGAVPYQANDTVLHTDDSLLPRNRKAWSSWNYAILPNQADRAAVTYNMNMLQSIEAANTFCVSLNMQERIETDKILGRYLYYHPVYLERSVPAQAAHGVISGQNRTHYCGAYWGYGFHEDGVKSGLAVGKYFGKSL
jgi:predicted NAD/FAD-binding protein